MSAFIMNDYRNPCDQGNDITKYSLSYANVVMGTLKIDIITSMRVSSEITFFGDRGKISLGEAGGINPTRASCHWFYGLVYIYWSGSRIPDHEICCSYSFNPYIVKSAVSVDWRKEGF